MNIYPVISLSLLLSVGMVCLLSSVYQWVWWWRLSGLGNIFYSRLGHSTTRWLYAVMGIVFIVAAFREFIGSILATDYGKLFLAAILITIAVIYYVYSKANN